MQEIENHPFIREVKPIEKIELLKKREERLKNKLIRNMRASLRSLLTDDTKKLLRLKIGIISDIEDRPVFLDYIIYNYIHSVVLKNDGNSRGELDFAIKKGQIDSDKLPSYIDQLNERFQGKIKLKLLLSNRADFTIQYFFYL